MSEEKNTTTHGQSAHKSSSSQKYQGKKPQKEQTKAHAQTQTSPLTGKVMSFAKKIEDFGTEIENTPLKSFDKKDQSGILQSYEKLITKMIREINKSRQ